MSGFKRNSSQRSNRYSESKYTNWTNYDPFSLEISTLPNNLRSESIIEVCSTSVPIYVRPLHSEFMRPFDTKDVKDLLSKLPSSFLKSLNGIYLLGGTAKQLKSSKRCFCYGCYMGRSIYLHAFPKRMLTENWQKLPKPSIVEEYERMGANWKQDKLGWHLEFDRFSLKRFYLLDVLLHELGHHLDKRVWERDNRSAEGYANWFAQEYARLLTMYSADNEAKELGKISISS